MEDPTLMRYDNHIMIKNFYYIFIFVKILVGIFIIPHDVLDPLRDEDQEEEEEEVGGRVADELQERFPHRLQRINEDQA